MIASDALGTLGEQKFGVWCAEENLTFNKVVLDRAGWDFIIDFAMTASPGISLDHRPGPRTCRIQVKTIGDDKNAVRLRLDMAERLAKDSGPSFIVGLRVSETFDVVALHVLPMLDDRLASVLKRLREASLNGDGRLSKKTITFPLARETQIELSGRALKSALLNHIGSDLHAYIDRKQEQLKQLGYEERPFTGTFTLAQELQDELEQMFLGHDGRVAVSAMQIIKTRFGLSEVVSGPQSAVISLKARPFDACTVTVWPQAGTPLIFDGDLYLMPPVLEQKMRIQLKLFDLRWAAASLHQIDIGFDLSDKTASPHEWLKFWQAMSVIPQTGTLIELACRTIPIQDQLALDASAMELNMAGMERGRDICAVLDRVALRAAWPPSIEISWRTILELRAWFDFMDEIASGHLQSWVYSVTSDEQPQSSDAHITAFVCHVPVGDHMLVCSATATMTCTAANGTTNLHFEHFQAKQSAVVTSSEGLQTFVQRFKHREGLANEFVIGPITAPPSVLEGEEQEETTSPNG